MDGSGEGDVALWGSPPSENLSIGMKVPNGEPSPRPEYADVFKT